MNTHGVPASIVSLIAAYNGGDVTDEHLCRFLANPNIVFGCDQEIVLIGEIPKNHLVIRQNPDLPLVMEAGAEPVYWIRHKSLPKNGARSLMVGKERIPGADMDEAVSLIGVSIGQPVLQYSPCSNMGSYRIRIGKEFFGPYGKILFTAMDRDVVYVIAEHVDDTTIVSTHVISNESHVCEATPAGIAEVLKRRKVTHCGIHQCPSGEISFHFIAHEEKGQLLYWQAGTREKKPWTEKVFYKKIFGVYADDGGMPVLCFQDKDGYYIRGSQYVHRINAPPTNRKFCATHEKAYYWMQAGPGSHVLRSTSDHHWFAETKNPDVDLCIAGDEPLFSYRNELGDRIVKIGEKEESVATHREVGPLQFDWRNGWPFYSATDDGNDWFVRWGDYKGPPFDEIYSVRKAKLDVIEYVARKRRRLYLVFARRERSSVT